MMTHARWLEKETWSSPSSKLPRYGAGKLVMEFIHTPPVSVMYSQIGRYRERGLSGRWDLLEAEGGGGVILKGRMSSKTAF